VTLAAWYGGVQRLQQALGSGERSLAALRRVLAEGVNQAVPVIDEDEHRLQGRGVKYRQEVDATGKQGVLHVCTLS
jgi:hypothetical protein